MRTPDSISQRWISLSRAPARRDRLASIQDYGSRHYQMLVAAVDEPGHGAFDVED
jgi:hypothetical protein